MKWGLGNIAFMVGIFGSIIVGLLSAFEVFTAGAIVIWILVAAGLVIGFMNVKDKESVAVMVASLVLGGFSAVMAFLPVFGDFVNAVFAPLFYVIGPMAAVVAIKTIIAKAN